MKNGKLNPQEIRRFRRKIYAYFGAHRRDFSWRRTRDPYVVFLSEIMLQQTQVERVERKLAEFTAAFPDFASLAAAPLARVLRVWQGMGYNRRALYLREAAREIVRRHGGRLPDDVEALDALPGVGAATARSLAAFAFNRPVVFIETNIRSVFIHEFFPGKKKVSDAALLPLVDQALDRGDPRRWYNALMDYGTMLKERHPNPSRRSAHYAKQSPYLSSDRRVRGIILKLVARKGSVSPEELVRTKVCDAPRLARCLGSLVKDGLLEKKGKTYRIP